MPAPPLSPPHHRVWPARQSPSTRRCVAGKAAHFGSENRHSRGAAGCGVIFRGPWRASLEIRGCDHLSQSQRGRVLSLAHCATTTAVSFETRVCHVPGTRRTMPAGCVHPLRARAFKFETRRANDPTDPGPKCELALKRDWAVGARRRARARAATIPSRRGSCDSSDAMRCDECDMMRCDRCPSLFVISRAPLCCTAVAECS